MTREERDYLTDVAQLGCIACRFNGFSGVPAEVHHQRSGTGAGRRASHFAILTIRYDDNHANRIPCWERVNCSFHKDKRIPKAIRANPVMLRLFIMTILQHPELQIDKGKIELNGKSRMTLFRWRRACEYVCNYWIGLAEDQACHFLGGCPRIV